MLNIKGAGGALIAFFGFVVATEKTWEWMRRKPRRVQWRLGGEPLPLFSQTARGRLPEPRRQYTPRANAHMQQTPTACVVEEEPRPVAPKSYPAENRRGIDHAKKKSQSAAQC